ncbi:hypothetical protein BCV72DRAFT_204142 [Rhizopus microsporus var. microsporus]|uniref:Uncharacterized protein n=2 Tax=Rhizopus microsporus TaxID=58291 RepID=A0A2G4ST93_RHIZD|nr:uncharacterized protein RHIMIDRAFT_237797 [Rhizopus microsporus ATCC 52813]ORE08114.1 hypothetical protein BCV72DRAFT_204142 [Rhizopus microsporus var. microsporus]PHZ11980.1 hypothetical protein RHIMIDRAFT_237797 [Rhizopus microsporus ATCC 52813]
MATVVKEEKDEYYDVDDGGSIGGDSGFSTGEEDKHDGSKATSAIATVQEVTTEQSEQLEDVIEVSRDVRDEQVSVVVQEEMILIDDEEQKKNFFTRVASIPIIQDSYLGAHNIVRQHTIGQKALDYAETKIQTILVSAQSIDNKPLGTIFSHANDLGNRSLDLLERQFPMINSPTQEIIQPIKGRLDQAVSLWKEKGDRASMDRITDQFERLLDYYLPAEQEEKVTIQEHGVQRLVKVINILSSRITQKVMNKVEASKEEERRIRAVIKTWIIEQAKSMIEKRPFLKERIDIGSEQVQTLYNFTQTELDKVRQELNKQNLSHMERVRSIWTLSRNDIILPLFEKSSSLLYFKRQDQQQSKMAPVA